MTKYSIIITFWDTDDQVILEGMGMLSSKEELDDVLRSELSLEEIYFIRKVSFAIYASIEKNNLCKWLEKDAITVYEKGKWPLLS